MIIKEPNDLRATLATMKSAKRQGVNMNVWDRDIEAVENAIAVIEEIRSTQRPGNCEAPNGGGHTTADCPGTECRRTGECQVA